ncbi:sel1 repeat family protein [bacterium AH-315-P15]|nr:sel1 repeat family protein [bacterium AH-315-P15]
MNRGHVKAAIWDGRLFYYICSVSALIVLFAMVFATSAWAQQTSESHTGTIEATFDDGYAAYQRGAFYEARLIWEPLAAGGDTRALYNLGTIYAEGRGTNRNMMTAQGFWEQAAEAGHVRAMHNLALSYIAHAGVLEEQDANAEYDTAIHWLDTASQVGFANSQYTLGKMYQYGLSVEQNDALAAEFYILAADQGFANAQYNLGKAYRDGRGVTRDIERSIHYFRLAAEQGHARAQNRVATRYARGEGVEQNDVIALMWASLAADQGDGKGIENRYLLLGRMSEEQIAEAQALIDAHNASY